MVTPSVLALEVKSLSKGEISPEAKVEQLSWLTGYWQGVGLGGVSEEHIGTPRSGQIPGMFRQMKPNGDLMFYEFYLFAEVNNSVVLRIKHFGPDLHGWEARNEYEEFALVEITDRAVYFDGVSYALDSSGNLSAAVRVSKGDEPLKIINFNFERKSLK